MTKYPQQIDKASNKFFLFFAYKQNGKIGSFSCVVDPDPVGSGNRHTLVYQKQWLAVKIKVEKSMTKYPQQIYKASKKKTSFFCV